MRQELVDIVIALVAVQEQRPRQQPNAAQLGHDQGLDSTRHGARIVIMERD